MDFFKTISKEVGGSIASDGLGAAETNGFIDTGSYILNAVLSGSIYGGMPNNKVYALAGETTTGKCARGSEKITIYCENEEIAKFIRSKI